jgi:uncharacterized membrane protein
MRGPKVRRKACSSLTHKLMAFLAAVMGLLITSILFKFENFKGITGYSVLGNIYGGMAPIMMVVIVVILIALYVKLVEN